MHMLPRRRDEIYFYPGGYGGLSNIEGDLSRPCFCCARDVRRYGSDPEQVLKATVLAKTHEHICACRAQFHKPWLSGRSRKLWATRSDTAEGLLLLVTRLHSSIPLPAV